MFKINWVITGLLALMMAGCASQDIPDPDPTDTTYGDDAKVVVEFRLQPTDDGTRLTITEKGFLQFPESKRLEVLRSNQEGWDIQATNIAEYVAG